MGDKRIDEIGTAEIEHFKGELRKPRTGSRKRIHMRTLEMSDVEFEGKILQPSTINSCLAKLSSLLTVAKDLGVIKEKAKVRSVRQPDKDPECYSFAQVSAIIDAATAHFASVPGTVKRAARRKLLALHDLAIAMILLDTGIRVGELISIHPSEIDLDPDTKHIRIKYTQGPEGLTLPKGNKERAVPITGRLVPILRALMAVTPGPRLLMRTHRYKGQVEPWNSQAVTESLNRTLTRAGMPPDTHRGRAGRGPHKCRHSFATMMLRAGVDLATLQKILGHRKIEQTAKYVHMMGEDMQRGSARYEAQFAQGRHGGDETENPRSSPPTVH